MDESFIHTIAIIIIIFIICIALFIFAPRGRYFFDKDIYKPELDIAIKDVLLETTAILDIVDDDTIDDKTMQKVNIYRTDDTIKKVSTMWKSYPDKNIISGRVFILPLFMLGKINKKNAKLFSSLIESLRNIQNIQSVYFVKINVNSSFIKHTGYANISNKTLRYIYCFNAYCYDIDESGIWIEADAKKLIKDSSFIYDSSKQHSIYNKTASDVIYLIIDFDRPSDIPDGYSESVMSEYVSKFFKNI
jgi:hypothetical protein